MIDDREDGLLSPEHLARYDVPRAPDGFAARVMAAVATDERTQPVVPLRGPAGWRRYAIATIAAAAVVIAVAWAVGGERARGGSGAREATTRETIALATRGVAVAEPGTELRWTVASSGDTVIDQASGSAFYRVERGGPFEVRTPLGVVSVTGTCFSVEVIKMTNKQDLLRGAAVGAALAIAVVVTVYEGRVTFANPHGELRLVEGDAAIARAGAAPETRGPITAAADPQARALADARARIATLEQELRSARGAEGASAASSATRGDPGRYFAPAPETLLEMANTCRIAYDLPGLDTESRPELVDDELSTGVGVARSERDAVNQAYLKVHDRAVDALRRLYMELTGNDADAAAALAIGSLGKEILAKSGPAEELAARRQIARERAGLEPSVAPGELAHRPIVERYLRIMMGLGNEAEAAAAGVVGAKRARELRAHGGVGWNNAVTDYGSCDQERR
ncbi:MAG: FecR protein [Deltaproteobacteria bacterium]|nr:FecR protein [Deltaproteobacteria bacterium]